MKYLVLMTKTLGEKIRNLFSLAAVVPMFLFPSVKENIKINEYVSNPKVSYVASEKLEVKKQKIVEGAQKALFLTGYSMGNEKVRENTFNLIEISELNAVVFNAKDDSGIINYDSNIELAKQIDAVKPSYNIEDIVNEMDQKGIYSIARVVVFKDPKLAKGRQDLAIKDSRTGSPLLTEKTFWPDPYSEEVWNYNIEVVKELAKAGIDEVQFDYIRFPARGNVAYASYTNNKEGNNKIWAIENFLKKVREETKEYSIKISADVFGFVLIEKNDQGIGQMIENMAPYLDYMYPMVYPSHYGAGFLGFDLPEAHPYEVVKYTLEKGIERLKDTKCLIIPWIQAFGLKMNYTSNEILAQIKAAEELGINGYLCWNAGNKYSMVEQAMKLMPNENNEFADPLPNEIGQTLVLEYHNFDYTYKNESDKRWKRTYDDFNKDLQRLYDNGYRLISVDDFFVSNNVKIPYGFKPAIITFDDGSKNQLKFKDENGKLVLDDCAVKVMLDFFREHPDFGIEGTFYLNNKYCFGNENSIEKLNYLVNVLGMNIGNHTYNHVNLAKISEADIAKQMSLMIKDIKDILPDYEITSLALPFGIYPKTETGKALVISGNYEGITYHNKAVFLVGANPSYGINNKKFDPKNIPRIQAIDSELDKWFDYFNKYPEKAYVSDGNPAVITIPVSEKSSLNENSLGELTSVIYLP